MPEFYRKLLLKMVTDGRNRSVGKSSQVLAVGRSSASHPAQAATDHGTEIPWLPWLCHCHDAGGRIPSRKVLGRQQEVPRPCCPSAGGREQRRPGPCSLVEYPKASSVRCCWAGAPFKKGSRRWEWWLKAGVVKVSPNGIGVGVQQGDPLCASGRGSLGCAQLGAGPLGGLGWGAQLALEQRPRPFS